MPIIGIAKVTAPQRNEEWTPVAENVYQVVIKDIDEKEGKKYQSEEMTVQYLFKLVILDEGEFKGQMVSAWSSTSWFGGTSGKKGLNPSKLVTIFKAIYSFYLPGVDVNDMEAEEADSLMNQNVLTGAQLRVVVKLTDDKKGNKVSDFMSIRQELEIPEDVKIDGEFKLKKIADEKKDPDWIDQKQPNEDPNMDDFIKGLEEDQKLSKKEYNEKYGMDKPKSIETVERPKTGNQLAESFK